MAQQASEATWMALSVLRDEVEDKRNMGANNFFPNIPFFHFKYIITLGLKPEQHAAITEFWKSQNVLVVTSEPLFEGMTDPSKINTPKISRSQLTCS